MGRGARAVKAHPLYIHTYIDDVQQSMLQSPSKSLKKPEQKEMYLKTAHREKKLQSHHIHFIKKIFQTNFII
jgi:hypothetical protein